MTLEILAQMICDYVNQNGKCNLDRLHETAMSIRDGKIPEVIDDDEDEDFL